ncbi:MAG TPA: hypothetical protein DCZ94_08455 [Lentisphaeria bacterium]|nr:MAG: hypothetical protein A2X48_09230 [Lentisphaerae bacterium GWF2_49_21]HBC86969.1 hypothetical protein [Lentisphaeria bacterium]
MDKNFWKGKYDNLKLRAEELSAGKINSAEFKKSAAPLGIYEQSNGRFMVRIRVTGGHLTLSDARTIINVARKNETGHIHLTTRQDLQLHEVATDKIHPIVTELNDNGILFRGGGGDTYRNIVACPHSGISPDSIFDVQPYAKAADEFLREQEKAFQLPRKFKVGFSCCKDDASMAVVQDLGFIAKFAGGKKGFEVWAGGGMGRESSTGVKIFDFLPEEELLRCIKAVLEIFHDHGDRTNRAKARLRFYVQKIGANAFANNFYEYFGRTDQIKYFLSDTLASTAKAISPADSSQNINKNYDLWKNYSLSPTVFGKDIFSVRIFVPNGNLSLPDFEEVCNIAGEAGYMRISQGQDILLPSVNSSNLESLYEVLSKLNLTGKSFNGLLTCCVGATVCKIGILDSPAIAKSIAESLELLFAGNPEKRAKYLPSILNSIKISGCPNACGGHPSAILGFQGMKKDVGGKMLPYLKVYTGADLKNGRLAVNSDDRIIPAENAGDFAKEYLETLIIGKG